MELSKEVLLSSFLFPVREYGLKVLDAGFLSSRHNRTKGKIVCPQLAVLDGVGPMIEGLLVRSSEENRKSLGRIVVVFGDINEFKFNGVVVHLNHERGAFVLRE